MKKKIDLGDSNVVPASQKVDQRRNDPIKARELENRVSDDDLDKYSHLSEQSASFMATEEMKELSSM